MLSKLPKWVEYGAFLLAFMAGCVNAVGLLGFQHQAVSHLSGTATLLGAGILNVGSNSLHLLFILVSFGIGAALSGLLIENSAARLGRHYGSALLIEGLLLLFSMFALKNSSGAGHYLASAACGLQNALVTTYSGAVVRTTHITGIMTDLGIMLGALGRGEAFDRRKAILLLLILAGFISGGSIGALLFGLFAFEALLAPALLAFILAATYWFYTRLQTTKNSTGK